MLRIVCDTCGGDGKEVVIDSDKIPIAIKCSDCNGKGYTEHEGSLEDLELAQATKFAFERKLFLAYISNQGWICASSVTDTKKLVEMYREHKGGTE